MDRVWFEYGRLPAFDGLGRVEFPQENRHFWESNDMADKTEGRRRVFISDHTGNRSREARLAADAPMRELIPALIRALRLPATDPGGRPVTYHVAYNDRQLQPDESLRDADVAEGASINIVPEMTAGLSVGRPR